MLGPEVTGAEIVAAYAARAEPHREIVRAAPTLEAPCLGCEGDGPPAHELLGLPQPIDLRWTLLHLIEETAHHAGHADATARDAGRHPRRRAARPRPPPHATLTRGPSARVWRFRVAMATLPLQTRTHRGRREVGEGGE